MDLHHILYTIAYGLIILGLLLIAPCFFKCCKVGDEGGGGSGKRACAALSWLCIVAGFVLCIINVWIF